MPSFAVAAASWQNFYVLVGTAAATLIGLMFVALTFGANLLTPQTSETARSFIDPSFSHFVQILATACLVTMPTMGPTLLGVLVLSIGALRTALLVKIFRHMLEAHRRNHDLELSDWVTGVGIPLLSYLLLAVTGVGFVGGYEAAFDGLAIVTVALLLNGVFGAWELMVWMAVARAGTK